VNVKVGAKVDDVITRGSLIIGRCTGTGGVGKLAASFGGTMEAYVTELVVGKHGGGYPLPTIGTLDLAAMDSVTIDADSILIGEGNGKREDGQPYDAFGTVKLPAGTVVAGTVAVGDPAIGSGLLQLNGTTLAVSTALDIRATGTLDVRVAGTACGPDLADAATLAINGTMNIVFDPPTGSGLYCGLRWAGDHAAELQDLVDAAKLTWDDTALTEAASIFTLGGYTYVGVSVAMAKVTAFAVTDQTTGSSLVTNSATVNVAITAEPAPGETIDGYAVTETPDQPTSWEASVTAYTIAGAQGDVTLYGWAKDTAGNVASKSATIYYSTATPVVTNVVVTATPGDTTTATVTWDTDINALGAVTHKQIAAGATETTELETALGISHSVLITGLATGVNNKITVVNNEVVGPTLYWPTGWPIMGDANLDCTVNILDLIFIRNKLNQDPATGNNWQANVNGDTSVNILDLIYVRNRLNTHCP